MKKGFFLIAAIILVTVAVQSNADSSCECKRSGDLKARAYCGFCTPKPGQRAVSSGSTQLFWFSNSLDSYKQGCTITSWTDGCEHGGSCNAYGVKGTISRNITCTLHKTNTYGMVGTMAYQAWNNGCVWSCN